MHIYIMDNDYEVMKKLEALINGSFKCKVKCFTSLKVLVDEARSELPDAVLIDFDEPNSLAATKIIKSISPDIGIIMMSTNKCKAVELFELGLNGFILKPPDDQKVKEQLFRLKHPMLTKLTSNKERNDTL